MIYKNIGYALITCYVIVLFLDIIFQETIISAYPFYFLAIAGILLICYSYIKEIMKNKK